MPGSAKLHRSEAHLGEGSQRVVCVTTPAWKAAAPPHDRFSPFPWKTHPFASTEFRRLSWAGAAFLSGVSRLLRCGKDLGQLAEVTGGCCEEEVVICVAWAAKWELVEAADPFEVGKEHLDLLSQLHRDGVLVGLGDVVGDLTGVFMFLAGDLTCIHVRAAFRLGRTCLGVRTHSQQMTRAARAMADRQTFGHLP